MATWIVEEHTESFIVKDANGQALGYLCFDDEPPGCLSQKIHAKNL